MQDVFISSLFSHFRPTLEFSGRQKAQLFDGPLE
jgi:hypothetical protein